MVSIIDYFKEPFSFLTGHINDFVSFAFNGHSIIVLIGGGFIIVPAMIYLLGMPTSLVVGTSLFQIIFVAANTTILQASQNQTVDIVLATILLLGSVIGVQLGSRFTNILRGEYLRLILSSIIILVSLKLLIDLVTVPTDLFSVIIIR